MKDAFFALGMGGPDNSEAIAPFLRNLLSDKEIIDFHLGRHLQNFLAGRIAKKRAPMIKPFYDLMGGGSPQLPLTLAFAKKVAFFYEKETARELDVYAGMCYWHPFIEDTISRIKEESYSKIYLFPMYPQYSRTTVGACYSRLEKILKKDPFQAPVLEIRRYNTHLPYLKALAKRIKEAAEKLGKKPEEVHVLFSAHSLPKYIIDAGDPYVKDIKEQIRLLTAILPIKSHSLSFQSKLGRKEWLTPSTTEEIIRLARKGEKDIVVVAIAFVNDHIETLVELDVDLMKQAEHLGLNMVRAVSLNDSDDFALAVVALLTKGSQ